ncbi:uncharacterized protein LOC109544047 isoform X1 [Dendroctonus ponderosae]|uniref:Uncharacterized protein n=2 Tax=Dendroctonus ponderosae TaxID=77166 RepID=A0AAR5Q8R2_DENPD|nr:uncharacterized protein LOC109544047 isoform X1 [Dendroctonus ponderosae]
MGVKRFRKNKPKPRPKPVINYPPVPTKKWIPPDQRKKQLKPEPKYVKPEGISQKLAISTLGKVWNKFSIHGEAGIITGHFSQFHKRFSFKSNGFQGACNSGLACAFSQIYKMALWSERLLDEILLRGDELYVRSTQQGDKCLIEVPPEKMHTSFFLGQRKITLFVSPNGKLTEELTSSSEDKAKAIIEDTLGKFLEKNASGIFYMKDKYAAVWVSEGVYYFFDPGEHDEYGNPWKGIPGGGFSFLGRFKALATLAEHIFLNFPSVKEADSKVHIIPCGIARIVLINTTPPETFEDLAPQDVVFSQIIEEPSPLPDPKQQFLEQYVEEGKTPAEPLQKELEEMSPEVDDDLPQSRRPSFLPEGHVDKHDLCRFPIPIPSYLKGEHARLTYYTELIPDVMGILRASTSQMDPNFSKYMGRESMGNALSALIMLRLHKSKHWVPRLVDTVLRYGELLYRDAMLSIPRTHSLRLSNFPSKIEYEGKKFTPIIDEYAVVGQMHSQEYEILDLGAALDDFLTDFDCCIVQGPQIIAFWVEDGVYYMFDPNDRDQEGKAQSNKAIFGSKEVSLQTPGGVACVVWCQKLKDLVSLYVHNTEKALRDQRFYISKVVIKDYVDISDDWYNFKGIDVAVWILRGSFSQISLRFSAESRNSQGTANALISLAMSTLFDEQEWSSDTVDEILMTGDEFYRDSVETLQEKGAFISSHLMLFELKKRHRLRDKEAEFELEECLVNGLINARNSNDVNDLRKGLEEFFIDNDYGVITMRDISLPIWKKKEIFYYLDPYSRDEKGISTGYGTSCVIRFVHLDDVVNAIVANLEPNLEDFFNITKVKISLYEAGAGAVKPPINNYTAINETSAILRGWLSEQSSKYEIRRGRQTVPMCIAAVAFNKLKPSGEWTKTDVDVILDKGDELYVESMADAQKVLEGENAQAGAPEEGAGVDSQAGGDAQPAAPTPQPPAASKENAAEDESAVEEEEEEEPVEMEIKISSENVKTELDIGPNNLTVEFADVAEGNIKETLKDALKTFFEKEQTDDDFNQEALLESKHYTVALWRDDKCFYAFDPRPRDKKGEVIGKDDWDPEPPEPEPMSEELSETEEEGDREGSEINEELPESPAENFEDEYLADEQFDEEAEEEADFEEEIEEEEVSEPEEPPRPKMSPSYWLEQEKSGRACSIWFINVDDLVNFVYNNIPVKDRLKSDFTLKSVKIVNNLKLKSKYNPEDQRTDAYCGDWYDFKEVEHGRWILRGSLDITHDLFPEYNRGRQGLTCSIMALCIADTFEMTCFLSTVPDTIQVYGDKLYTFMRKSRTRQLLNDPNSSLKDGEIDWLLQHENFSITDIPKKICVAQFMVELSIVPGFIEGDIKAQNFEEILDVKRGLEKFFEDSTYGVMCARDLYVAVWKGQKMFYMFDGMKRGPNGVKSTIGTGCITRYMDVEKLAEVFLENLPALGKGEFVIHQVTLERNLCPREREPKDVIPVPKAVPKSAGLKLVIPGKSIIRGTITQEDPKFGKGPNTMSAPIAVVALTMSLIHKPENWSRPIIDDIVTLGAELYEDSVNDLGFDFNPWEDTLDVYRVKHDFKLGVVKANCELRQTDQKGYIDCKESDMQNLRQGMSRFFEENTHGILVTQPLTVAVWEQKQEEGDPLIYIFDPNPRNATGMPLFTGTACALAFVNEKMASDHVIGCILDPEMRAGEFVIVPVEIVVGNAKTVRKQPQKSTTRSSINVLPRCSKLVASEQKKKLRKLAEEDRKKKEAKKRELIGRNGYHLRGAEAILRGYKSQNSDYYDSHSRNKQDIPNCIASVVMHSVLSIEDWNHRHIDLILDTGDQLYIDSYIAYGPDDPQLGMENILRKFFMGSLEVHVTIYKSIITEAFTASRLNCVLEAFFQQETVGIINYNRQWISVFFKSGYYFMFDPHERDIEGNPISDSEHGSAAVVRFDSLNGMTLKIINNLGGNAEENEEFMLWIMSVEPK